MPVGSGAGRQAQRAGDPGDGGCLPQAGVRIRGSRNRTDFDGPNQSKGVVMNLVSLYRPARALLLGAVLVFATHAFAQTDPLPSWNDGAAKKAIVEFVQATTTQGSPKFVPPAERIATFDQDGTLWVEQPMYAQVMYCLDRVPALVKAKPELAKVEPFKTVLSGDRAAIAKLSMPALEKILAATLTGMSVDEFNAEVKKWLAEAKDPRWKKPYTELTYLPMQEVLKYLRANGYKTYIVTGGGQDFVRTYAEATYGIPPEQVVGTAGGTKYAYGGTASRS